MHVLRPPTIKQLKNEKALTIYAAFLCALILSVVATRWLYTSRSKAPATLSSRRLRLHRQALLRPASLLTGHSKLQKRSCWKWFGRPSHGLVVLVGIYLLSNVLLSSTILATYRVNHFASRFGWMGAANMALCVFFGLKNTPLALVTAVSRTQLNIFHRIVGYTTTFLVLLHAIFYTIHFGRQGRGATLCEAGNREGLGSGVAMFILLMGVFRHQQYQTFYVSHTSGFIAAVILTGLHRPDWAKKLPVVMLFIACMWSLDRGVRAARMCYNLVNNHAAFYPLPGGGTRLLLRKPYVEVALPGSHCFLWTPRLQLYQAHPFTIVSNGPSGLELVIKSVCEFAIQHPGCATWVSVDGPYGTLPDTAIYDKLVLIAGGSGAAFTFGLLNRMLNHSGRITFQSIDFVWAVKSTEHLSWFSEHLHNLERAGSSMKVRLYITSEESSTSPENASYLNSGLEDIQRLLPVDDAFADEDMLKTGIMHPLLSGKAQKGLEHIINVKYGKMSTERVICEAMQGVEGHHRVLVVACGPTSLLDAVRDSVDHCEDKSGYSIDVHCEDFGA
ncbi:ferric reductase NAD binding domain-containing protein [Exophiala viscosa]|uniref:Ferric reductase NAD binding domain-containing protein n=1 Tax=Exophiala viscosa TaxID=2486360 RepID=A0AAN6DYB4_9EURO|nr:ferric reductase NAD binding domain-containing protein [Exophiala viscosa]KAI1624226.1 ferric reductase NAD binding domain-containing protein [Exophiala viscosa]